MVRTDHILFIASVDARPNPDWTSTGIEVHTANGSIGANSPAMIENAFMFASYNNDTYRGTGVRLIDRNEQGLWNVRITAGGIQKLKYGLHFRAEGGASWVNTCFFDGVLRNNQTAILMDSDPLPRPVNGHQINVTYQPKATEWFWDLQAGRANNVRAFVWDSQYINEGTLWRIGERADGQNVLVDQQNQYSWDDNVVEQKFGGAPNGAGNNALFNWSTAMNQREMLDAIEELQSEVEDLQSQ
jgi:hypothetical protein